MLSKVFQNFSKSKYPSTPEILKCAEMCEVGKKGVPKCFTKDVILSLFLQGSNIQRQN